MTWILDMDGELTSTGGCRFFHIENTEDGCWIVRYCGGHTLAKYDTEADARAALRSLAAAVGAIELVGTQARRVEPEPEPTPWSRAIMEWLRTKYPLNADEAAENMALSSVLEPLSSLEDVATWLWHFSADVEDAEKDIAAQYADDALIASKRARLQP